MLSRPLCPPPRALAWLGLACALAACEPPADPPGRSVESAPPLTLPLPDAVPDMVVEPRAAADADEPGHGAKIASIAMRTWVYVAPDDRSTKLGYLRAGAVIDRAEAPAGTKGCDGGFYRVVPRGYVCVGKGASLSLDHEVVLAAARGPDREGVLPYEYVFSRYPPPHLYFRLPNEADQLRVEGKDLDQHVRRFAHLIETTAPEPDPIPTFLSEGHDLPKPYGAEKKLHYSVHAGRAKEASAFGLMTTFAWTGRRFGLTTELDLIPLDRTKVTKPSTLQGVEVKAEGTPAFVKQHGLYGLRLDERGRARRDAPAPFRSGWVLTGKNNGSEFGLLETTEGLWLPASSLLITQLREDPAGYAEQGRKWIDVSITRQTLVAYEGKKPVYAAIVSTGRGRMGDPEKTTATVRGTFLIHAKHVSATMDGDEASDAFDLRDVPYIQYFHEGYALHAAYWHDEFGKPRSHGCVNLAPADAKWLFEWTDPVVPAEWHGAVTPEGGTLVYIHA